MSAASPAAGHAGSRVVGDDRARARAARLGVRTIALLYLLLILALPVVTIFFRTFESGLEPVLKAIQRPAFQSAFWLTLTITAITVPVNTVFGIIAALAIVRRRFPGRSLFNALIDLPFALSPVVIGLSLFLVYGKNGWLGGFLADLGITVIFALPGMVLATLFVCAALRRPGGHPGAARDRHGRGRGCLHAGCVALAHLLARHPAGHPMGRHLRRSS